MLRNILEIFFIFLRLGLTSFGGPMAHLGYFHNEFVDRRKWFDETTFTDLVSLCQFLPGPASSQVGIAIGLKRGGVVGAIAAWLGFTLPSALIMIGFAFGLRNFEGQIGEGVLHGLKLVAVPVVAQALWGMGSKICTDKLRASIAIGAAIMSGALPFGFGQVAVILIGGCVGLLCLTDNRELKPPPFDLKFNRKTPTLILFTFAALLILLPRFAASSTSQSL